MKVLRNLTLLTYIALLSGCIGLSDYMKYPPPADKLWAKLGISSKEMYIDLQGCGDAGIAGGIADARDNRIYTEGCMLKKDYVFTNFRSTGYTDYCSQDWYGGGPACKSVGR